MSETMKVLLIEDDETLGDGIAAGLEMDGMDVTWKTSGREGLSAGNGDDWDCVILDLGLPDLPGMRVLSQMREAGNASPVIILTARDGIDDRVRGLDAGGDDYMAKPFDLEELRARIRALHRRHLSHRGEVSRHGALEINMISREVSVDGKLVELSKREFELLALFMGAPAKVWESHEIEDRLYGMDESVESNALAVHVHNLRAKIGRDRIRTVRGLGYRLAPESDAA